MRIEREESHEAEDEVALDDDGDGTSKINHLVDDALAESIVAMHEDHGDLERDEEDNDPQQVVEEVEVADLSMQALDLVQKVDRVHRLLLAVAAFLDACA